jgi:bacterioferritin-associated ferredoxin
MNKNSDSSNGCPKDASTQCQIYDCLCFDVSAEAIRQIIIDKKIKTWDDLVKVVEIGGACGMCVPYIKKFLENNL